MTGTRSEHTQTCVHANGPDAITGAHVKPAAHDELGAETQSLFFMHEAVHRSGLMSCTWMHMRAAQSSAGLAMTV